MQYRVKLIVSEKWERYFLWNSIFETSCNFRNMIFEPCKMHHIWPTWHQDFSGFVLMLMNVDNSLKAFGFIFFQMWFFFTKIDIHVETQEKNSLIIDFRVLKAFAEPIVIQNKIESMHQSFRWSHLLYPFWLCWNINANRWIQLHLD